MDFDSCSCKKTPNRQIKMGLRPEGAAVRSTWILKDQGLTWASWVRFSVLSSSCSSSPLASESLFSTSGSIFPLSCSDFPRAS